MMRNAMSFDMQGMREGMMKRRGTGGTASASLAELERLLSTYN